MYIRPCRRTRNEKDHVYWELVESYRTERGPRQRVVAYLGDMAESERAGVEQAAAEKEGWQQRLFDEKPEPQWEEVDIRRIHPERVRDFGGYWLGLQACDQLGLTAFLESVSKGKPDIPWSMMNLVLVLMRLCNPSSELRIAEHLYERSSLDDLLGIPADKVNDDRLYRSLDSLLPHKNALEKHLKERMGELFNLEYDLLLYDVTSTYFEGAASDNEPARRGYSRDHRPDCKQVCIGLIVSREGIPLGYEVFKGNRHDVTTVEEIINKIESQYGKADRIWAMDRGMVSEDNLEFLRSGQRRYILGTPKNQLKQFEQELLKADWKQIRSGLEVKLCPTPEGTETFVLCRSQDRAQKEKAIHARFEKRIEEGLEKLTKSCGLRKQNIGTIERRVGRLLGANSRAAGLFQVAVTADGNGNAIVTWKKVESWREWAELNEGCYLLRTNILNWEAEQLWQAYTQLTEAEEAFRIQKGDLGMRPVWHQKERRVNAHILVCFLAYVLWKTIGQKVKKAGLGDEPRKVFDEIARIKVVDIVIYTKQGIEIRKRCIAQPDKAQLILLQKLNLHLPQRLKITKM
jgi:transposase